jgi:acetyl-CoA acyltransferase
MGLRGVSKGRMATSQGHSGGVVAVPADGQGSRRGRIAIVRGLRTPFARSATAYRDLTALDLGALLVRELLARAELDPREVDMVVFGQAVPGVHASNVARDIVLGAGMPRAIQAFSVSRACATSLQAMTSAAEAMLAGQASVAIVGGTDSASDAPIVVSKALARAVAEARGARTLAERLRAFARLSPSELVPVTPATSEPSPGMRMGDAAESMAKEARITREQQDAFAHRSHARAASAWNAGVFADEVMHVVPPPSFDKPVTEDNVTRRDWTLESYAKLPPAFDPRHGTVTAGNSTVATDGAAALLLMTEARAKELGYAPLGYLRSWAYSGADPNRWPLMGPAFAAPAALDTLGAKLNDLALIEMHEAFAAQVLCNVKMFGSRAFARQELGRDEPLGEVDMERFNVHGGSIAIGHPSAATGARIVTTLLHELRRRGGGLGLVTGSAAGGLGAAAVMEAVA